MRYTLALVLFTTLICAAEPAAKPVDKPKLPEAAKVLLGECEDAVKAARADYDARTKTPFDATEKLLKSLQSSALKAGRKDEAKALQDVIDRFRYEILERVDTKARDTIAPDLLGDFQKK